MKYAALLTLSAALSQAAPQWGPPHQWGPPPHWGGHGGSGSGSKKAIYFLRVDPQGSDVVSVALGGQGKLTQETTMTSTGGVGLQSTNYTSPTKADVAFDPLQVR